MRISLATSLLAGYAFATCLSPKLSAQSGELDASGTSLRFEVDPDATWGPSTTSMGLAIRIGIHIERNALLTLESAPADLLIQNVDSEGESVTGGYAELLFAIRVTALPETRAQRKNVPLKAEFLRRAPRSTFAFRGYELPAKAAVRYRVDLARWFDFKNPGSYEVQICYAPVPEISEGYDSDKRCELGPEVTTVVHLIPAVHSGGDKGAEKGKPKQ